MPNHDLTENVVSYEFLRVLSNYPIRSKLIHSAEARHGVCVEVEMNPGDLTLDISRFSERIVVPAIALLVQKLKAAGWDGAETVVGFADPAFLGEWPATRVWDSDIGKSLMVEKWIAGRNTWRIRAAVNFTHDPSLMYRREQSIDILKERELLEA